jgi:hypothetical protein
MALLQTHPAAAVPAAAPSGGLMAVRGRAATAGIALTILFGAWISLAYAFGAWGTDPDIADPMLIWSGLLKHGPAFVKTWYYTQDNWLFSLVPLVAPVHALFGASPALAVASGWVIFLSCVSLTSLLAWRTAGALAAGSLAAMLLFANNLAAGAAGFLTYPVVHNITLAWGLGALALAARGLARRSAPALAGTGLALLIGALSDPWLNAAMTLPLLVVAAGLAVLHRGTRAGWRCLALCLVVAAAWGLAQSRMLGLLAFLPPGRLDWADMATILANLGWLGRAMSAMFNIIPGADPEARLSVAVNCTALLLAATGIALPALRHFRRAEIRVQLLTGVALVSVACVTAALLLGSFSGGIYVGRYMMNLYFLGPLLGTLVLARGGAGRPAGLAAPARAALLGWVGLFMVSGACSRPAAWAHGVPRVHTLGTTELADFLQANDLSYGYGPYWGSNASVIEWVSGGRVVVRPVVFDRVSSRVAPRQSQTSPFWYTPADRPAGQDRTFLIVVGDGENCPAVEACVAAAAAQFGRPARRLGWRNMSILVWPHEILSRLDR